MPVVPHDNLIFIVFAIVVILLMSIMGYLMMHFWPAFSTV